MHMIALNSISSNSIVGLRIFMNDNYVYIDTTILLKGLYYALAWYNVSVPDISLDTGIPISSPRCSDVVRCD